MYFGCMPGFTGWIDISQFTYFPTIKTDHVICLCTTRMFTYWQVLYASEKFAYRWLLRTKQRGRSVGRPETRISDVLIKTTMIARNVRLREMSSRPTALLSGSVIAVFESNVDDTEPAVGLYDWPAILSRDTGHLFTLFTGRRIFVCFWLFR